MWEYTYTDELYHYGVPGMKWGRRKARLERRSEKKYRKAGHLQGRSDYYKGLGDEAMRKHENSAKLFDAQAKKFDKAGSIWRAEASRKAAEALRQRGANQKASQDAIAERLERRANKMTEKASAYATKKRVDLGKKRIDAIFAEGKQKGYDRAKTNDTYQKEKQTRETLGDDGYRVYNKIRGKSQKRMSFTDMVNSNTRKRTTFSDQLKRRGGNI
jgi:hypothetical protein